LLLLEPIDNAYKTTSLDATSRSANQGAGFNHAHQGKQNRIHAPDYWTPSRLRTDHVDA